jgi:putative redox protein
MQTTIRYLGGVRFEAEARGHKVICDQPLENHGTDQGMTPPEFLLASLGTCAGFYAAEYLRTRGLPSDGLAIQVDASKAAQPARLGSFTISVTLPEVEQRHREGVLRAIRACLVHNTLLHSPQININIAGVPEPAAVHG